MSPFPTERLVLRARQKSAKRGFEWTDDAFATIERWIELMSESDIDPTEAELNLDRLIRELAESLHNRFASIGAPPPVADRAIVERFIEEQGWEPPAEYGGHDAGAAPLDEAAIDDGILFSDSPGLDALPDMGVDFGIGRDDDVGSRGWTRSEKPAERGFESMRTGASIPKMSAPPLEEGHPAKASVEEGPRIAYALLDAPGSAEWNETVDVHVGLAAKQSEGVSGDAFHLPESTRYPYTLTVQLVADGFESVDGKQMRRDVTATLEDPYPKTTFRVRVLDQEKDVRKTALHAIYSIEGQTIGFAHRPIELRKPGLASDGSGDDATAAMATAGATSGPPSMDVSTPTAGTAPDLTIHVMFDSEVRSRLLWTVESPHAAVTSAAAGTKTISSDIGDRPADFAKALIAQMNGLEGTKGLKKHVRGVGRGIAENIPAPVWAAFQAAAAAAHGPPSILILSEEAYVPWELALIPDIVARPLPVPDAPEFLGTQANVGRWVLGQYSPPKPPPHRHPVRSIGVISGTYNGAKWKDLQEARAEAQHLRDTYQAMEIDAKEETVHQCLENVPPTDALHFAIHGIYSQAGTGSGLVTSDEKIISPEMVKGSELDARPFVFLNACQVGTGDQVLGDYAGMAGAFLDANATAVVAPLWSVKDSIARTIAVEFYKAAMSGETVASVVRAQRARYGSDDSATYLAYQYYGHPNLSIHP